MPSISFQPVLHTIKELLQSRYYTIPRFQRPYSWTAENLEDFWRDVVLDNAEGYFIGPMVAYGSPRSRLGIVDGQQRITSITLALSAMRDIFVDEGAPHLATGLHKYLERADEDNVPRFVLESEATGEFFQTQFQVMPDQRSPRAASGDEERALVKAHADISSWLTLQLENHSHTTPPGQELSPRLVRLREIRDRILALQIVWIRLDNEDDAYIIFETLNSRGKDLEVVDLLKNHLLSAVRNENGDLDTARTRWVSIRNELSVAGKGANPNKFILHWWLSQYEYTAERKLFRLIKQRVTRPMAAAALAALASDAPRYARIANPSGWQVQPSLRRVRASLEALTTFGVSQPRPMLLAVLRSYEQGKISAKQAKRTLGAIENFHYLTTAIAGMSSTGGTSEMYAKHARELTTATNANARATAIDGLVRKLAEPSRRPTRDTFISEFPRALRYSAQEMEAKRLVQYTLRRLHDAAVVGTALAHERCNIEHLHPQSSGENWAAEIGNLLWIDERLNGLMADSAFDHKKVQLAQVAFTYDLADVLAAAAWGETEVAARSQRLAEFAFDKVWAGTE